MMQMNTIIDTRLRALSVSESDRRNHRRLLLELKSKAQSKIDGIRDRMFKSYIQLLDPMFDQLRAGFEQILVNEETSLDERDISLSARKECRGSIQYQNFCLPCELRHIRSVWEVKLAKAYELSQSECLDMLKQIEEDVRVRIKRKAENVHTLLEKCIAYCNFQLVLAQLGREFPNIRLKRVHLLC